MRVESPRYVSRLLAGVLLAALALRLGWGFVQPTDEASILRLPDQREYLEAARNLLGGRGLTFYDPRFEDQVYAVRMPGYPLLVAACRANVRLVRVVQAFVDTSTVLAIFLLARRWLPPGRSLFAAALVALNPFLVYFSGLLLSETLYTAMLAWGMCLLVRSAPPLSDIDPADPKRPHPWRGVLTWLGGGVVLALSVHVRQSGLPLAVVLGIAAAFVNRPAAAPYHRRWPLPVGTTMLLLTGLALLPWAYRNSRVIGTWVWTTTNGGITAYDGLHPDATGASDQTFVKDMPELRGMNELGRDEYLASRAKRFVGEYPWRVAELAIVKTRRTWSPVPLSEDYQGLKYQLVGYLFSVPFDLLVLIGLFTRRRAGGLRASAKAFLLIPALYFTFVHALSVGSLRYRIPVEPPMAVIAAAAMARLPGGGLEWKRAREVGSARVGGGE